MTHKKAPSSVETPFHMLAGVAVVLLTLFVVGPGHAGGASVTAVPGAKTVDTDEAKALHDNGAVFVDVRSPVLWDAGRIPGAYFLPKEEVSEMALAEIASKTDDVVFYCQGIKCPNSSEACVKALSWGYSNVYYYRDGYPAWQASGLEIE